MLSQTSSALDLSQVPALVWAVAAGVIPVVICLVFIFWPRRGRKREGGKAPPLQTATQPKGVGGPDPFVHGGFKERRNSLRRGGNPVPVFLSDAEARADPYPGWVVDRSMGGICLSVEESVAPGTILSVRAANAPNSVPWVQIEIRNCRAINDRWELGCQFVRTPPWGTLLLFG